jgi:histidine triad (HIT) family protein
MNSMRDPGCLFCKIVSGEIPGNHVLKTDEVTAFRDLNPQASTHVLVVPNHHVANTEALDFEHDALVGPLLRGAREVARLEGLSERGYRLVINTGDDAGNTVPHLHLHVIGGRKLSWPPG